MSEDKEIKRRTRRPARERLTERLEKVQKRAIAMATDLKRFSIDTAPLIAALDTINEQIQILPDDVKRARQNGIQSSNFEENDFVALKEKLRDEYDGLISTEGMDRMKVLSINNRKVYCETPEMNKVQLPKGHLYLKEKGLVVEEDADEDVPDETPEVCAITEEVPAANIQF